MKCNRAIVLLAGFVLAMSVSVPVLAGIPEPECLPLVIEINALRGGSPTVVSGGTKDITSKARIQKGTALADETVTNTKLTITSYDPDGGVVDVRESLGITLVVGKGGQGDKLTLDVGTCNPGEQVSFVSEFTGTKQSNGATCTAISDRLYKTCK